MSVIFYEYAKCSTCVKARKWLEDHKVKFEARPIIDTPPSAEDLRKWQTISKLDIKKFFNTSGQVYRELDLSAKLPVMSTKEMFALLASNGKLIKRPMLIATDHVLVGFSPEAYQKLFS